MWWKREPSVGTDYYHGIFILLFKNQLSPESLVAFLQTAHVETSLGVITGIHSERRWQVSSKRVSANNWTLRDRSLSWHFSGLYPTLIADPYLCCKRSHSDSKNTCRADRAGDIRPEWSTLGLTMKLSFTWFRKIITFCRLSITLSKDSHAVYCPVQTDTEKTGLMEGALAALTCQYVVLLSDSLVCHWKIKFHFFTWCFNKASIHLLILVKKPPLKYTMLTIMLLPAIELTVFICLNIGSLLYIYAGMI